MVSHRLHEEREADLISYAYSCLVTVEAEGISFQRPPGLGYGF